MRFLSHRLTLYAVQRTPLWEESPHGEEVVPRPLIDLLWRDHPDAPVRGSRGPQARVSTGTVVDAATRLADADGLAAVTIRRLASELEVSTMSVYTHVNSRDDLLVLMADAAHAGDRKSTSLNSS